MCAICKVTPYLKSRFQFFDPVKIQNELGIGYFEQPKHSYRLLNNEYFHFYAYKPS